MKTCPNCGSENFTRDREAVVTDAIWFEDDGRPQYEPSARHVEDGYVTEVTCADIECGQVVKVKGNDGWWDDAD